MSPFSRNVLPVITVLSPTSGSPGWSLLHLRLRLLVSDICPVDTRPWSREHWPPTALGLGHDGGEKEQTIGTQTTPAWPTLHQGLCSEVNFGKDETSNPWTEESYQALASHLRCVWMTKMYWGEFGVARFYLEQRQLSHLYWCAAIRTKFWYPTF